jgi:hypothetical protein
MIQTILLSLTFFILTAKANYCNLNGCSGVPQGCCGESNLLFCNDNENQCESACGGQWCDESFSYCSWSTCDGILRSTEWCNAEQGNCVGACGGMWCTNDDGGGSGTTPPTGPTPTPSANGLTPTSILAPTTLSAGTATTTRYWDCSGGACGCASLPFGPGTDSQPTHCHSNAMFVAPLENPYGATFYGTAAVSQELFGYNTQWLGRGCGTCYKLTGSSNIPGTPVVETTTVLKAANLCPPENPACSENKVHFDIAVPGFDVTRYSYAHVCETREAAEDEGFSACEFWMLNSQDATQNCDCSKFHSPVLQAGCSIFLSLNWNNPPVQYEEVECPMELDRLNCWEENDNAYPIGIPDFCESNVQDGASSSPVSTSPPTTTPAEPPTNSPSKHHSSPTTSPIKNPSEAPTKTPVVNPTMTPSTRPSPATNAPSGGASFCCSNDYKECNVSGWCSTSKERCETSCRNIWIEVGSCSTGLPKWSECTHNVDGCCAPATCQGNEWYRQCV